MTTENERLADELTPGAVPSVIIYVEVLSVAGSVVTVDVDGVPYPVPYDRCYGCGGTPPAVGSMVAVHRNGSEANILGSRSLP